MGCELLILDEPTSQLDPLAAHDFLTTLQRLCRELSLTVLLCEHRLEDILPICDRLMVLDKGRLFAYDTPRKVIPRLSNRPDLLLFLPTASRLALDLGVEESCPLSIREGRNFLEQQLAPFPNRWDSPLLASPKRAKEGKSRTFELTKSPAQEILSFSHVSFRYEKNLPDVLQELNLTIYEREFFCLLGGNGSGKSTALRVAAGLETGYMGKISVFGKKLSSYKGNTLYENGLILLPQDVQTLFSKNTVEEELSDSFGKEKREFPTDLQEMLDLPT
jgi:energy-coupling factor transport system ATP-binding protein